MKHLEQMTWKERIHYALEKGDDLTIGEWEWLLARAGDLPPVAGAYGLYFAVEKRKWQKALTALERLED